MTYKPQPGTFSYRAIAFLETMKPGYELSSAALAEELGQPPVSICSMLAHARDSGHIIARKEGRLVYWSLPTGDEQQPEKEPEPKSSEPIDAVSITPCPKPKRAPGVARVKRAVEPEFRAGLFTDGTVTLDLGYNSMTLSKDNATKLASLLARCV